jgi:hypothetical protein
MFAECDHAGVAWNEPAQGEGDEQNAKQHRDNQYQSPNEKAYHGVGLTSK